MISAEQSPVTGLLRAWSRGEEWAIDQLMPMIYGELRRLASRALRREPLALTLDTRDLLQEALLRLCGQRRPDWRNRGHFFAIATQAMRRILVDHARRKASLKRGGEPGRLLPTPPSPFETDLALEVLDVQRALEHLGAVDRELEEVVVLRYFGGFTVEEVAELRGVSVPTVYRQWRLARSWLLRRLSRQGLA